MNVNGRGSPEFLGSATAEKWTSGCPAVWQPPAPAVRRPRVFVPRGLPRERGGVRRGLTGWDRCPNLDFWNKSENSGGVDGARTRDLRRDRPRKVKSP